MFIFKLFLLLITLVSVLQNEVRNVGLEYFYSDSNGHHEPNPRFLRKSEKSIKHAQRRIYTHLYTFAQNDQKDKLHLQPEFRQYCRVFSLLWRKCRHFLSRL